MTYGGPSPRLGPEYQMLEKAGRSEQASEREQIRLEVEATEARRDAEAEAAPDRPNLIERLFRIGRARRR